nr:hypothetical protein Cry52Nrm1_p075 [Cryptomonas curvata]
MIVFLNFLTQYLIKIFEFPHTILIYNNLNKDDYFPGIFIKKFINSITDKKIMIEVCPKSYKNIKEIYNFISNFSREILFLNYNQLPIKFVIVYDFEKFKKFEQITFKALVDKYSYNIRFIFISTSLKNLIEEIYSRFICISFKKKNLIFKYKMLFQLKKIAKLGTILLVKKNTKTCEKLPCNYFIYFLLLSYKIIKIHSRNFIRNDTNLSNEYYFLFLEFFKVNKSHNLIKKFKIRFLNVFLLNDLNNFFNFFLLKK